MAIESIPTVQEPTFKRKHSSSMRLWHWASFISISGSLLTVLLAKTMLNNKDNIPVVRANLQKSNITVTTDQAKSLAHEFSDMAWHWHTIIGYVLASLLGFRILFEFFQPKQEKVIPLIKNTLKYLKQPRINKKTGQLFLFARCMYILFYISLAVQACTGLFLAYSDGVASLKDWRHSIKNIHNVNMWVIIAYIVIHLGGVLLAELGKKYKGIVSEMINGGRIG